MKGALPVRFSRKAAHFSADAQRRLLSAANTLGMSRGTIQFIERRSRGDMYVLLFGAVGTLVSFWCVLPLNEHFSTFKRCRCRYILRWFG